MEPFTSKVAESRGIGNLAPRWFIPVPFQFLSSTDLEEVLGQGHGQGEENRFAPSGRRPSALQMPQLDWATLSHVSQAQGLLKTLFTK